MFEENIIVLDPLLQCKVLDVHMTASLRRSFRVCHHNGGIVVFVETRCIRLRKPKFNDDSPQEFSHFCGCDGSEELHLCGAATYSCEPLGAVSHGSAGEAKYKGTNGTSGAQIVGTCRVEVGTHRGGKVGEWQYLFRRVHGTKELELNIWEGQTWSPAPINHTVFTRLTEIAEDMFQLSVVDCSRICAELGEFSHSITYVDTKCDIGEYDFADPSAICETGGSLDGLGGDWILGTFRGFKFNDGTGMNQFEVPCLLFAFLAPAMVNEDLVQIRGYMYVNIVPVLEYLETVEVGRKAQLGFDGHLMTVPPPLLKRKSSDWRHQMNFCPSWVPT
jgi:hypothetical protein